MPEILINALHYIENNTWRSAVYLLTLGLLVYLFYFFKSLATRHGGAEEKKAKNSQESKIQNAKITTGNQSPVIQGNNAEVNYGSPPAESGKRNSRHKGGAENDE